MALRHARRSLAILALAIASLVFLAAVPAANAGLIGSTLGWQYYANGGPYTMGTNHGTWVVDGGVGGTFGVINVLPVLYFNIIADDTSITFDYLISGTWSPSFASLAPTIRNGIAINMISGPAFTGVTIDPATNMMGFGASRFSFTGSQIQVDWQNLSFTGNTIVKLDVTTAPVPEPSSSLLLGFGLTGLGVWRKRRSGVCVPRRPRTSYSASAA